MRWVLLLLLASCRAQVPEDQTAPSTKHEIVQGLAPGKGRKEVLASCTPCHSTKLVVQNRMTREQWDETLTWMEKKQKMWPLPKRVRGRILDYLGEHQGPVTVARRPDTPWAEPSFPPNPVW